MNTCTQVERIPLLCQATSHVNITVYATNIFGEGAISTPTYIATGIIILLVSFRQAHVCMHACTYNNNYYNSLFVRCECGVISLLFSGYYSSSEVTLGNYNLIVWILLISTIIMNT